MKLNRRKFQRWLEEKRPDEIVGHQRDCHSCPIALFYADATSGHEVVIFDNGDGPIIDRGYIKTRAPRWAAEFIWAVDGTQEPNITAARALGILIGEPTP